MENGFKQIVGAAIVDSLTRPTRLLAARRSAPEHYAGMWEFPGGKVEPGESCEEALRRELREELGVDSRLGAEVEGPLQQGWPLAAGAAMRVWLAEVAAGEPLPLEDHDELRWVPLDAGQLGALPWIPADLPIVTAVLEAAR
ncbi:(deoxy)nucleoside triphosphate pyrophosphohydrolase [Arthrobacter mobilis]|uniref:8-oxo-dGTP diphosphatase n=1 Tax=Arthrobacter mobilis TaxID=2724944 RepID=A0A7X6HFC2_9MICC|nr:(deoxy)nucleoside triphosphate pyrophosphohydrolase [Arthrobacter mobilis]NKX56119.1 (deoxy)nucleoside triphosphate pyrophosphohydrolase [Arthrobacter mobilis]